MSASDPLPPDVESWAGTQLDPFHFNTWSAVGGVVVVSTSPILSITGVVNSIALAPLLTVTNLLDAPEKVEGLSDNETKVPPPDACTSPGFQ